MHYIVKHADEIDLSILSNLLFRGVKRSIKNNNGKLAREMINDYVSDEEKIKKLRY